MAECCGWRKAKATFCGKEKDLPVTTWRSWSATCLRNLKMVSVALISGTSCPVSWTQYWVRLTNLLQSPAWRLPRKERTVFRRSDFETGPQSQKSSGGGHQDSSSAVPHGEGNSPHNSCYYRGEALRQSHSCSAGQCGLNTKCFTIQDKGGGIRNTTLVLEFPGATRNLVFAGLKSSSCTLQSPSSFISLKGSHTVLVKKSRFALESGLSSRSHSFTAKLQIIPPHRAREAAAQAHYVLSKSIWEEQKRKALFWSTGADEYLREITEVSTAGEWEFMYSQRTAYQWCQINHGDPVSAWDWKWTDTLCSLHVCTAAKPNHQETGISEWLVAAKIHCSSAWDQYSAREELS